MARTIVGLNDPKSVKKWSGFLAVDVGRSAYFSKKFFGVGEDASAPIVVLEQLESDAGEQVVYDLSMQLKGEGIEGDNILEGTEEDLKFYTDQLYIDQLRHGVNTGGRMTRKRTLHDMRKIAKRRLTEWWARIFDEVIFMYLSGARGVNADYVYSTSWTGRANNPLQAPDSSHILYGGSATSKASLTSADKMSPTVVERLVVKATMMGGGSQQLPQIQPIMIDGEEHYVLLMNPFQAYDMRTASGTNSWSDYQKALATAVGNKSPIFKGGLGMVNNVVLHMHKAVVRFSDYGAGANVAAARALFMGVQAGAVAFGSPGTGMRFDWHEEMDDRGNQLVVDSGCIWGMKKCQFAINGVGTDFGVVSVDTAAADPG